MVARARHHDHPAAAPVPAPSGCRCGGGVAGLLHPTGDVADPGPVAGLGGVSVRLAAGDGHHRSRGRYGRPASTCRSGSRCARRARWTGSWVRMLPGQVLRGLGGRGTQVWRRPSGPRSAGSAPTRHRQRLELWFLITDPLTDPGPTRRSPHRSGEPARAAGSDAGCRSACVRTAPPTGSGCSARTPGRRGDRIGQGVGDLVDAARPGPGDPRRRRSACGAWTRRAGWSSPPVGGCSPGSSTATPTPRRAWPTRPSSPHVLEDAVDGDAPPSVAAAGQDPAAHPHGRGAAGAGGGRRDRVPDRLRGRPGRQTPDRGRAVAAALSGSCGRRHRGRGGAGPPQGGPRRPGPVPHPDRTAALRARPRRPGARSGCPGPGRTV